MTVCSKHLEQHRHQHQQWSHNNLWQDIHTRGQLRIHQRNISNYDSTSKRRSTNIRLLDQRRTHVEICTCPTSRGLVHTATDRWWTRLTQHRMSFVRPTNGTRGIEYDWTTKRTATLDMEWTGSTNFEERPQFKDGFITEDIDEQQEAKKAKGIPAPQQPTEQERMEHELTHLPYRSWRPVCVQGKGRADKQPKQCGKSPEIQATSPQVKQRQHHVSWCRNRYVHGSTIEDRKHHIQYLSTCLQQFLMECGETQATQTKLWYTQIKKTSW